MSEIVRAVVGGVGRIEATTVSRLAECRRRPAISKGREGVGRPQGGALRTASCLSDSNDGCKLGVRKSSLRAVQEPIIMSVEHTSSRWQF